jgi:TolB-like protein/predicted Ser/Thr protein kinase
MLRDFGDYELLEEIGRGGQGVVYRARQKSLNRVVALKVIALGSWATEAHFKRFRREAEAAASLDHVGIVPIYEFGQRDGCCYFSMKIVEGNKLDQIAARDPMTTQHVAQLMAKLARAVGHAHERGVLHRDIKPGNVLIDHNREPHLTDFGLARMAETEPDVTSEMSGTPSYMAPEQVEGKAANPATDIYGLGTVLYQLLTGHPPFLAGSSYETVRAVLETEPRRLRSLNTKVDVDLETICLKCLEKDPHRRYESAVALAHDLERWLRDEPIQARRTAVLVRSVKFVRRNPTVAILVPLLIALAIALGALLRKNGAAPRVTGVAVLPFENLDDDKTNSAFADGVQDDILTRLATVRDLKVISRTSVARYRGAKDARMIGRALGVSHVLEGSVRRSGNRIRLNAQLIDTDNEAHVWAEQYDRDVADLFAIQSDIAQKIAKELTTKISAAERSALTRRATPDLAAYDFYLRGKALMQNTSSMEIGSLEQFSQAAELLEQAVARDPNFALAYCALAEAQMNRFWRSQSMPDALTKAEAALQSAQRLAPEAGETYLAQALYYYWGHRDYDRALEALDNASHTLPNDADVSRLSAQIERRLGRWKESMRHSERASELDPRAFLARDTVISTLLLTRHYAEVRQLADQAIADLPEKSNFFRIRKVEAALSSGDLEQAQADLTGMPLDSDSRLCHWTILVYRRDYAEAFRLLARAEQREGVNLRGERYPVPFEEGITARAAGDADKARAAFLAARRTFLGMLGDKFDAQNVDLAAPSRESIFYFPEVLSEIAVVDVALGRKEEALREGRRAVALRPISRDALDGAFVSRNLALTYCWAGEHDRAVEELLALAKEPGVLSYGELKFDPCWDEVRNDPRFAQILAQAARPIPVK